MIKNLIAYSLALLLGGSLLYPGMVHADNVPTFSLSITNASLLVNNSFQVKVNGSNLSDLYAYEINLTYDTERLHFESGESVSSGFALDPTQKGNTIQLAHTQIGNTPGQNGDLTLATLTFKAIDKGVADIALTSLKLVNAQLVSTIVTSTAKVSANIAVSAPLPTWTPTSTPTLTPTPTPNPTPTPTSAKPGVIMVKSEISVNPITNTVTSTVDAAVLDKAIQEAKQDASGKTTIHIEVEAVKNAKEYVQQLPAESISDKEKPVHIKIITSIATMSVPTNMFQGSKLPDGKVGLHIAKVDIGTMDEKSKKEIGAHPVIELSVEAGGKTIAWNNPHAPIFINVPYTPTTDELKDPEKIVIWYIDGKGKINPVPNGKYDPATGQVTFSTTHFSIYAISFVDKTFDDIASVNWAIKPIGVLASKGIINGTADSQFSPTKQVSRADFIVLLVRTLELQGTWGSLFADVPEGAYYDEPLRIARGLGITQGSGDNLFNPQGAITREDMMVLTDRALKASGKLTIGASRVDLSGFKDASNISDYAIESIATLVKSGMIHGNGNGIHPKEPTTRAESAVLMYSIYNN